MSRNFPSLLLSVTLLLTAIVLVWFGWYTYNTYNESYEKKLSDIRIEAVRGEIIHYDEILTMSTRMAVATGDPRWEQRYRESELLLNDAIQRAKELASEVFSQEASALTDIANQKLVVMENRAFDLIHQGRLDEAKDILYGATYLIQKRLYSVGMARFPITRFTNLRLVELQGIILHLDEVLTMSAKMAVITGDVKWETHYHQFVSLLDDAIRESIVLAPNVAGGKAAKQTEQANQKLVEMELKAFDLIHQARQDEAYDILFSQSYEEQKRRYTSGTEKFIAELNKMSESITRSEYRKVIWNVSAAFIAIALLLIGWLYVLRIIKIWHDEQKQAEKTLRISEERFRVLYDDNPSMYFTINEEGVVLSVNQYGAEHLGYEIDQLVGIPVLDIFYEEDKQKVQEYIESCLSKPNTSFRWDLRKVCKDGSILWVREIAQAVFDNEGALIILIVCEDITEAHSLSEQLSYQASHDALTNLVNRREFELRLQRVLSTVRSQQSEHALCYMDLDQFKVVNDTCGHIAGDKLLCEISSILQKRIRKRDTLARLGGDEFGVLMEHCSLTQAEQVAEKLRKEVENYRFTWENQIFDVGVSIGLVPIDQNTVNTTAIFMEADAACYAAKDAGRNRIHIYRKDDDESALLQGEMKWVSKINQALVDNRFHLVYQPIVALNNKRYEGEHYELLIRMTDEGNKVIYPGSFLPAAERYNVSPKLDRWVINTAFNWLANNPQHLNNLNQCSINISGLSFGNEDLLNFIIQQLDEYNIPGNKICFEITETAAISNLTSAASFIRRLKESGCKFALDDFGSGLSSFAYLKNLPVDYLKIDGVFVKDMLDDPIDLAMVRSINEIGHVMGKKTIAEFVENKKIFDKLNEIGVDYAQGYGVAMPKHLEEMPEGQTLDQNEDDAKRVNRSII